MPQTREGREAPYRPKSWDTVKSFLPPLLHHPTHLFFPSGARSASLPDGPAFSACGERSRGCFWIEQKNCHFGSSQRCAFVFAAPRTFVIRVKKVKSGTGQGVDNENRVSREARDIHSEAAGEG